MGKGSLGDSDSCRPWPSAEPKEEPRRQPFPLEDSGSEGTVERHSRPEDPKREWGKLSRLEISG